MNGFFFFSCYRKRRASEAQVQSQEAQAEQEAEDAVHARAARGAREEVPRKEVPVRTRACRVRHVPQAYWDSGNYPNLIVGFLADFGVARA